MLSLHRLFSCITLSLTLLLAACGSGSTFEPLAPSRIISFGDGLSDLGQNGSKYTVNDGTVNIWVERVATNYGATITASVSAGMGYAQGNARVNTGTNPISTQISTFLAANTIGTNDLIIVDAGVTELAELASANTNDAALATAADAAGRALAAQILRLTAAGGKHVVIANAPDLGKSPFATSQARTTAITAATRAFNDGLKLALANVTSGVLLVDNESYVNAIHTTPTLLGTGGNVSTAACSAASALNCDITTLNTSAAVTSATYTLYLYADDRHFGPAAHRLLGDNAYNKIKARW